MIRGLCGTKLAWYTFKTLIATNSDSSLLIEHRADALLIVKCTIFIN